MKETLGFDNSECSLIICLSCSLDAESFSGLDALTQLNLSHNLLTSIDTRLFAQLSKIEVNLEIKKQHIFCKNAEKRNPATLKRVSFKPGAEPAGESLELFLSAAECQ